MNSVIYGNLTHTLTPTYMSTLDFLSANSSSARPWAIPKRKKPEGENQRHHGGGFSHAFVLDEEYFDPFHDCMLCLPSVISAFPLSWAPYWRGADGWVLRLIYSSVELGAFSQESWHPVIPATSYCPPPGSLLFTDVAAFSGDWKVIGSCFLETAYTGIVKFGITH